MDGERVRRVALVHEDGAVYAFTGRTYEQCAIEAMRQSDGVGDVATVTVHDGELSATMRVERSTAYKVTGLRGDADKAEVTSGPAGV